MQAGEAVTTWPGWMDGGTALESLFTVMPKGQTFFCALRPGTPCPAPTEEAEGRPQRGARRSLESGQEMQAVRPREQAGGWHQHLSGHALDRRAREGVSSHESAQPTSQAAGRSPFALTQAIAVLTCGNRRSLWEGQEKGSRHAGSPSGAGQCVAGAWTAGQPHP